MKLFDWFFKKPDIQYITYEDLNLLTNEQLISKLELGNPTLETGQAIVTILLKRILPLLDDDDSNS